VVDEEALIVEEETNPRMGGRGIGGVTSSMKEAPRHPKVHHQAGGGAPAPHHGRASLDIENEILSSPPDRTEDAPTQRPLEGARGRGQEIRSEHLNSLDPSPREKAAKSSGDRLGFG
jgi:hypothetical protein